MQQLHDGDAGRARAAGHHLHVLDLFAHHLQRVGQGGQHHHGGAVLIVVEHGDVARSPSDWRSTSKQRGAEMSSRLMPPKLPESR